MPKVLYSSALVSVTVCISHPFLCFNSVIFSEDGLILKNKNLKKIKTNSMMANTSLQPHLTFEKVKAKSWGL